MSCESAETSKMASEELRWRILKAMLDEFPELKNKTKAYLKKNQK